MNSCLSNNFWKPEIIRSHLKCQIDLNSPNLSKPHSGQEEPGGINNFREADYELKGTMFTEELGSSQWVGIIRKTPRS